MALTDYNEGKRVKGLRFWDVADPGEYCMVPCLPTMPLIDGDTWDCEFETVVMGVLGPDGLFRAEELPPFNPDRVVYRCENHCAGMTLLALDNGGLDDLELVR